MTLIAVLVAAAPPAWAHAGATDDQAVLRKVRLYMESGATGVMFGRNMWLRSFDHALALTREVHPILRRYSR